MGEEHEKGIREARNKGRGGRKWQVPEKEKQEEQEKHVIMKGKRKEVGGGKWKVQEEGRNKINETMKWGKDTRMNKEKKTE